MKNIFIPTSWQGERKLAGNKKRKRQRGVVLILVLFIISGLSLVSIELNKTVLLDHIFSLTSRSILVSKPLLNTCETLAALFLIRKEQTTEESEYIANFAYTQKEFSQFVDIYNEQLKSGTIRIKLEDENARFPIKAMFAEDSAGAQKAEIYQQMFERILIALLIQHGYEGGIDAAKLCAREFLESLLCWGGETSLSSEARAWYLEHDPPYLPPFRPPENMAELLLLYWPSVDSELAKRVISGTEDIPGLTDCCTLWSTGPLNINTVHPAVIYGFVDNDAVASAFVETFMRMRANQEERLAPGWYRTIFESYGIALPSTLVMSEQSRWYRVTSEAGIGVRRLRSVSVGWITKSYMQWVVRFLY